MKVMNESEWIENETRIAMGKKIIRWKSQIEKIELEMQGIFNENGVRILGVEPSITKPFYQVAQQLRELIVKRNNHAR